MGEEFIAVVLGFLMMRANKPESFGDVKPFDRAGPLLVDVTLKRTLRTSDQRWYEEAMTDSVKVR